jgi:hypothetical protein
MVRTARAPTNGRAAGVGLRRRALNIRKETDYDHDRASEQPTAGPAAKLRGLWDGHHVTDQATATETAGAVTCAATRRMGLRIGTGLHTPGRATTIQRTRRCSAYMKEGPPCESKVPLSF